ncbi:MAG: T9SS type A sorting domain-containing protein [Saprospiraceae bacterium]|nr:T9SS type A sorting domain-containing protein [Saprospiraceae bacterium]
MKQTLLLLLLMPLFVYAQWTPIPGPGCANTDNITHTNGVFFLTTVNGIYRSADIGLSWQLAVETPNTEGNVYAISGYVYVAHKEKGLLKSSDLGLTWDTLTPSLPEVVNSVVVTDSFVFTSSFGKVFRFEKAGTNQVPMQVASLPLISRLIVSGNTIYAKLDYSLHKSTDNGNTWSVLSLSASLSPNDDVAVNGDTILISNNSIYRSVNGGQTWSAIAFSSKPGVIQWSEGTWLCEGVEDGRLKKSTDAGLTWHNISGSLSMDYVYSITNTRRAIKVGDVVIWPNKYGCYRTLDNGESWDFVTGGLGCDYTLQKLTLDSVLGYTILGDFYYSPDGNTQWFAPVDENHAPQKILFEDQGKAYGEWSDKLVVADSSFRNWTVIDATPTSYSHKFYYKSAGDIYDVAASKIGKSSDGGLTWQHFPFSPYYLETQSMFRHNDKLFLQRISAGTYQLYRTEDFGVNWVLVGNGLPDTTAFHRTVSTDGFFYTFEINNKIYYSIDDGLNFNLVEDLYNPVTGELETITQIAAKGNQLFAISANGVYYTHNFGLNWTPVTGNLPSDILRIFCWNDGVYVSTASIGSLHNLWKMGYPTVAPSVISGKVYSDDNNNSVQDGIEALLPNVLVKIGENNFSVTNANGEYTMNALVNLDTLSAIQPIQYSHVNPPYRLVTQSVSDMNFGVYFEPDKLDLSVTQTNYSPFRSGFETVIDLTYSNVGTKAGSGDVRWLFNNYLILQDIVPAPDTTFGDTLVWHFQDLAFAENRHINAVVKTKFFIPIFTDITCTAWIVPTDTLELEPENNIDILLQTVVGSHDPNDKQVSPQAYTTLDLLERRPLVYTIRFQNTGNYPADFVRLLDTLHQNIDVTTFRLLAASHPVSYTIEDVGILNFLFEDINLVPETTDELASQGFVKFSVRPKSGLSVGDEIPNTANIYFDFNEPIVTNTTLSTIIKPVVEIVNLMELCQGTSFNGVEIQEDTTFSTLNIGPIFDTLVIDEITAYPTSSTSIASSICQGEPSPLSGTVYESAGIFIENEMLLNQYECDSLIELHLTVHPEEMRWVDSGPFPYGSVYQGSLLTHDTVFILYDTTEFGCRLTISESVSVLLNKTEDAPKLYEIQVSPNPFNDRLRLDFTLTRPMVLSISLHDAIGREVKFLLKEQPFIVGIHRLNWLGLDALPSGNYMLKISDEGGEVVRKVVRLRN